MLDKTMALIRWFSISVTTAMALCAVTATTANAEIGNIWTVPNSNNYSQLGVISAVTFDRQSKTPRLIFADEGGPDNNYRGRIWSLDIDGNLRPIATTGRWSTALALAPNGQILFLNKNGLFAVTETESEQPQVEDVISSYQSRIEPVFRDFQAYGEPMTCGISLGSLSGDDQLRNLSSGSAAHTFTPRSVVATRDGSIFVKAWRTCPGPRQMFVLRLEKRSKGWGVKTVAGGGKIDKDWRPGLPANSLDLGSALWDTFDTKLVANSATGFLFTGFQIRRFGLDPNNSGKFIIQSIVEPKLTTRNRPSPDQVGIYDYRELDLSDANYRPCITELAEDENSDVLLNDTQSETVWLAVHGQFPARFLMPWHQKNDLWPVGMKFFRPIREIDGIAASRSELKPHGVIPAPGGGFFVLDVFRRGIRFLAPADTLDRELGEAVAAARSAHEKNDEPKIAEIVRQLSGRISDGSLDWMQAFRVKMAVRTIADRTTG